MEFLEISEILPFGVDIADPIFTNSMIFVKHMGRYGYGGPPRGGTKSDPERDPDRARFSSIPWPEHS